MIWGIRNFGLGCKPGRNGRVGCWMWRDGFVCQGVRDVKLNAKPLNPKP